MTFPVNRTSTYIKTFSNPVHLSIFKRIASNVTPPQTVLIERSLEQPIIAVNEDDDVDIIGPPDPVSNLRPIIRHQSKNETSLQRRLRELQDSTQAWNHEFWTGHNKNFIKERQRYIDSHQLAGQEKKQLTADEMSEFYKRFLDENWQRHLNYNLEWYKKNFTLLFLSLRVCIEKYTLKFS